MTWYNYDYMQNLTVRNDICWGPAQGPFSPSVGTSSSITPKQDKSPMWLSLMNQIDNSITNVGLEPIFSKMNFLAHEVHVENSMLRNGGLLSVLFPQDGNSPRPPQWIIKSHQFHFGKIYSQKRSSTWTFHYSHDSNPCLSLIIHILNTLVVLALWCITKKYFHQIIKQDPVSESKAKSNKSSSSVSFCPDQRLSEILYRTCPGITNQGKRLSAILSIILHGLSNHFLYTINRFPEYQEV